MRQYKNGRKKMRNIGKFFLYMDFVSFGILEHVPETIFASIDKQALIPADPGSKDQPCLVKIAGMIPWFFILKPCLRYDLFCLPANLMVPERHPQIIEDLKQDRYESSPILEKMALKVLGWYYHSKGETTMLDIASVLEKSNDSSFVQFRKCRDMIFNEGKAAGRLQGELKAKRSILIRILEEQCGPVSPSLQEQICQIEDS
ncbi:MAG: hypothetical protein AB1390_09855 [Nitrospirota bacterium]